MTEVRISERTLKVAAFGAIYFVWGSTYLAIALVAETLPAFIMIGLRFFLAGLMLYAWASWASLFWINGILSWQLTPGDWIATRNVWDGFFNPSFWPSLLFRTVVAMTLAALEPFCSVLAFEIGRGTGK